MIIAKSKVVRRYKAGYEIREELWKAYSRDKGIMMRQAYTPKGDYIGDSASAHRLCKRLGIKPEKANPEHCCCSIGYSKTNNAWYGWSHRAICCFVVGDAVQEGDLTASSGWTDEYLLAHPEEDLSLPVGFEAKTLDDCKRMAIAFANAVA